MDSKVAELPVTDKLLTWYESNKTQVGYGAVAVVIVGIIVGYLFYHKNEQQVAAGEALTTVSFNLAATGGAGRAGAADAYLKVANDYPNSVAGARALLLAAGNQFTDNKYDQAKATFDRCSRDYPNSLVTGEALLGSAACLDAQGKSQEAATAYKNLIDRHPGDAAVPQAKFALARIYEGQDNLEKARNLFEEVARADPTGSLGSEAGMRLEEMRLKHPALFAPPAGSVLPGDSGVKSMLEVPATTNVSGSNAPIEKAKP
jgi:TolA-binding protein